MKRAVLKAMCATIFAIAAIGSTNAASITGNPASDGWTVGGRSVDLGTYVRGSGGFDFRLYTSTFTLDSGSALYNGGTWQAGDLILGIGAVVSSTTNLTQSVRIVAKYGSSTASFSSSSTTTPPGDGNGSFSGGAGGAGGILLGTPSPASHPQFVVSANAGVITNYSVAGSVMERLDNSLNDVPLDPSTVDAGRLIFLTNNTYMGQGALSSFEVFLNVSQLQRYGFAVNPGAGDSFVLTLQRSNNETLFTDALGVTGGAGAVPEPSSLVLAGLGVVGLAAAARRRRATA